MSEGLAALKELRENGAVSFSRATISFTYLAFTKRADIIEKELTEREQYKAIEQELGIDLVTYFTVKRRGYIYYKALDGTIRESKVWAQFFGYDWCWYIRSPKKNDRRRVRMKHYGKTWALTREELEK